MKQTDYGEAFYQAFTSAPAPGDTKTMRAAHCYAAFGMLHAEAVNAQRSIRERGTTIELTASGLYNDLRLEFERRHVTFKISQGFDISVAGSYPFSAHDIRVTKVEDIAQAVRGEIRRATNFLATGKDPKGEELGEIFSNLFGR